MQKLVPAEMPHWPGLAWRTWSTLMGDENKTQMALWYPYFICVNLRRSADKTLFRWGGESAEKKRKNCNRWLRWFALMEFIQEGGHRNSFLMPSYLRRYAKISGQNSSPLRGASAEKGKSWTADRADLRWSWAFRHGNLLSSVLIVLILMQKFLSEFPFSNQEQ